MSLEEKIKNSIELIKMMEPPEGYYLAFSGGKDSIVLYDLAKKAGVKFDAHYNVTTVDPPDLVRFIKKEYSNVIFDRPEKTMWKLIEERYLPTRLMRFCCDKLKERGGIGRYILLGIRKQESSQRKNRKEVEECYKKNKEFIRISPILEWTEEEVWKYIKDNNIKYPSLYDEGWKRIGCMLCPFSSKKDKERVLQRYPKIKNAYVSAINRNIKRRKIKNKIIYFESPYDWFDWWMSGLSLKKYELKKEKEKLKQ